MAHHRRIRRLQKRIDSGNLSQQVSNLVMKLAFPPLYEEMDLDEEQIQAKKRENAVQWVKDRHEIALIEANTAYKPEAELEKLLYQFTEEDSFVIFIGEYGKWPDHLEYLRDVADGLKAAELMHEYDIDPEEYEA